MPPRPLQKTSTSAQMVGSDRMPRLIWSRYESAATPMPWLPTGEHGEGLDHPRAQGVERHAGTRNVGDDEIEEWLVLQQLRQEPKEGLRRGFKQAQHGIACQFLVFALVRLRH